ncbi:hypothetical protein G9A89_006042 [Geosiphon pyriformis]|nr:hypothetical protein G9A89_006042 [Geosiphon pyriformis]
MLLDHISDDAFSGVIKEIDMDELLLCINNLPNDKAARLSGIPNELWRHCVLMISKSYKWNGVLTNTRSIALIETAQKILSKILSDQIFLAYNKFNVLCGDNFSVLKVVEDALEKNRELWLVLQDMHKAYDSVGWHHLKTSLHHIKIYSRFIEFFGGIYKDHINRVITDFGLSNNYIVRRHEHLYDYYIDTKFVAETGHVKAVGEKTFFLAAGAFVNNTIWVGSCVKTALLSINGLPILIAKQDKSHRYLGIFLSTEGLFKSSLTQAHANVRFFSNVVLRKAITDKQFSYLVSAVLQSIVSY